MTSLPRLTIIGATASPYTRKMIGLLRYRHIPYSIKWTGDAGSILDEMGIAKPKPILLPVLLFDDDNGELKAVGDSTPIIRKLEGLYDGRSVVPSDPAMAFIDYLLEDFGDEWCTKYMFHYRWHFDADADNAGTLLPLGSDITIADDSLKVFKDFFSERQISRLYVVGSNDVTAPIIDASYRRFLTALNSHLASSPFLLGSRPGAGDFAIYGQLTQLVGFDPTSRQIAHEIAPRVVAWVSMMEDLTGIDDDAKGWSETLPTSLNALLAEIGKVYVPAMLANAQAVQAGEKTWATSIDGANWEQQTFPYQAKCLMWINEQYQALSSADKTRVDEMLAGTGCEALILPA